MDRKKAIIVDFFNEVLDLYEMDLSTDLNSDSEDVFRLYDRQGANWSDIDFNEFYTLADVVDRLDSLHRDYIYKSLEDRENSNEIIPKDDWDLTVKRCLESDTVTKLLFEITPRDYQEIMKKNKKFDIKEIIKILDEDEKFYKNICQKYAKTMLKEMLLEKDNKILHIYVDDDYIKLKEKGKINNQNYKDYLDKNFEVYEYNFYQDFLNSTVKYEIYNDLNDLELFDENGNWNFYITFEELKKVGYAFMVKDQFPLLQKYILEDDKVYDFFNHFSLEELEDFEKTLHLYFETNDIQHDNKTLELYSKSNSNFNSNIIQLAEGLSSYENFMEELKKAKENITNFNQKEEPNYYDLSLEKAKEYFKENDIKDLMEYGNDSDEGLYHFSSLYEEIMDKLNIKFNDIYTEDVSAGKYVTTIIFENNSEINLITSAFNGEEAVAENVESICEFYEKIKNNSKENITNFNQKNEEKNQKESSDFDYDYN